MSGYVIKVTIENTSPPVWRRILIPEKISFGDLHRIIQIAFGWEDCHPHVFTFSKDQMCLTDERALQEDDLLEDGYEVDDLLRENKWVCYTYDFGDDWRHKIVFEKVKGDYGLRYATILKAEGDNFEEDSGGVWGGTPCVGFSMEGTNDRLSKIRFKYPAQDQDLVFIEKKPLRQSKMDRVISEWGWLGYRESLYEEKTAADRSCVEILQDLSLREIKDYCKCLQIPQKTKWNKKEYAEAIYKELTLHPEYLLYVLDGAEFQGLLDFCEKPEGSRILEAEEFAADKYMSLGLMDIRIESSSRECTVSYAIAQGAGAVIGPLGRMDWRGIDRKIRQDAKKLMACLDVYGIMEIGACYDICRDAWRSGLEWGEFLRLLYLYGRFNGYIRILEEKRGSRYVSLSEIDIEDLMADFLRIDKEIDHKKITWDKVQERQKSVLLAERYWIPYVDYLANVAGLEGEELNLWMDEERLAVMCGSTVTEMVEDVSQVFPPEGPAPWVDLWAAAMGICTEAGLFVLKGHSRREYEELTGRCPAHLPLVDREMLEEQIGWETHIYQMPEDIQNRLYEAYQARSLQGARTQIGNILEDLPGGNLEIVYMLSFSYAAGGDRERAEDTVKRAQELYAAADDPRLHILLETIRGERWSGQDIPYKRTSRKIGRNDPCPCGSGKKYKKCCGKGD